MNIKVGKYTQTPSGRKLKNKFIVYNEDNLTPLSSIKGTSRTNAYLIAKYMKNLQKLEGKTIKELQKIEKSKSKNWEQARAIIFTKRQRRLTKRSS